MMLHFSNKLITFDINSLIDSYGMRRWYITLLTNIR